MYLDARGSRALLGPDDQAKIKTVMVKIYTGTNVLRYFGTAFAEASLPEDLQVISQLGTNGD
jgi:hypothetical protein